MIRITLVIVLIFSGFALIGQSHSEAYLRRLAAPDSVHNTRVEVVVHGQAVKELSRLAQSSAGQQKIRGYRVRIFLDNAQSARTKAAEAVARFKEEFVGVPTYMSYENPYWKVSVGNCVTSEEAITLWGRVKSSFDRAFVVREDLSVLTLSE